MMTFMPHQDYDKAVSCLDDTRLSKQRVEAANILAALLGLRWSSTKMDYVKVELHELPFAGHMAVRAWKGHEGSLQSYIQFACLEYADRGFQEEVGVRVADLLSPLIPMRRWDRPEWANDSLVISSHRAVLLGKDFAFYSRYGWSEKPAVKDPITNRWPYLWAASVGH
jgi:hypothetical protein